MDLSFGAEIPSGLQSGYRTAACDIRKEFASLIEGVSKQFYDSLDFWVASAQLRDQYESRLFHDLIVITLVTKFPSRFAGVERILTDDYLVVCILRQCVRKSGMPIEIKLSSKPVERLGCRIRSGAYSVKTLLYFFSQWLLVRCNASKARPPNKGRLVLIDTFVIKGFVLRDRYYSGLLENLELSDQKKICFVPQFSDMSLMGVVEAVRLLRNTPDKFLLKESFLKLCDLVFILTYVYRVQRLRVSNCFFNNADVSALIQSELRSPARLHGAIRGLLNYRFVRRLKAEGYQVTKSISWFENQSLDKGWSIGFSRYFPETKTLGYQGFVSDVMAAKPTSYEVQARVVPSQLAVIGPGLIESCQEFAPNVDVVVAPAFRFNWINHYSRQSRSLSVSGVANIVVALPGDRGISSRVLKLLVSVRDRLSNARILIKAHPRAPFEELVSERQRSGLWINRSSDPLSKLFAEAHIVVSTELTSVGLEAALVGLPVIFFSPVKNTLDLMPKSVPEHLWSIARDQAEFIVAIERVRNLYIERVDFVEQAQKARKELLKEVTKETALEFLS
jgi:hypothetical protein